MLVDSTDTLVQTLPLVLLWDVETAKATAYFHTLHIQSPFVNGNFALDCIDLKSLLLPPSGYFFYFKGYDFSLNLSPVFICTYSKCKAFSTHWCTTNTHIWPVNPPPRQLLAIDIYNFQPLVVQHLCFPPCASTVLDMAWPAGKYSSAMNQTTAAPVQHCCVDVSVWVGWCPCVCTRMLFTPHHLPSPKTACIVHCVTKWCCSFHISYQDRSSSSLGVTAG